ncbi:MAG: hypothetical protein CMM62_00170 [Rhodospirillaceae bacterium]|jgi:hypothetical protein|nr:hypothetical protein [Rhodospirillaceae bacterium]MAX65186.1 hypothetical protein [Rhodospirillaceae bacterium]MBB58585.1 hypothetical protein [Rhodospirillaceae bacterium]|tara:strand:- start:432 stop:902 length:471 start_codon:yes stop_codon:yes gene_type:complete
MRNVIFVMILAFTPPAHAGWISDWFGGVEKNEHRFLSVTALIEQQVAPFMLGQESVEESRNDPANRIEIIDQCDLRATRQCIMNLYQPREVVVTLIEAEGESPSYEIGIRNSGGPRIIDMGTFSYSEVIKGIDLERDLQGKSGIWHFTLKGNPVGN